MVKKNENISANLEVCDFCINTHTHTHNYTLSYNIIRFHSEWRASRYSGRKLLFQGSFPPFFVSILCLNPKNKINKI